MRLELRGYSGCGPKCVPAPYCGDGIVQPAYEQCDDGLNISQYGGCAPGCKRGPSHAKLGTRLLDKIETGSHAEELPLSRILAAPHHFDTNLCAINIVITIC